MSNRLTFSLASLIFLIALGLVFVPTSVMAETPDTGVAGRTHSHPLNEELGDNPDTTAVESTVAAHTGHPMVTSIALTGGNTSGTTAVVVADDAATVGVAENTFTLVITFDKALTDANTETSPSTTSPLATADFGTPVILNKDKLAAATDGTTAATVAVANATRVEGSDGKKFEAVVTIDGSFPSGTAADDHEVMYVRLAVNAAAGFGLASRPGLTLVNGGASLASSVYEFKLVKSLPDAPMAPGAPTNLTAMADQAAKTITLDWDAPSDTGTSAITGYTVTKTYNMADDTAAMPKVIPAGTDTMITIPPAGEDPLPENVDFTFTVTATNAAGTSGSSNEAMARIDTAPPTIETIGEPTMDAMGKVVFTLTFNEPLAATGLGALQVTDFDIVGGTAMAEDLTGSGMMYTLKVTPTTPETTVMISLRKDAISDAAGNALMPDESTMATYDKTAPMATITSAAGTGTAAGKVIFTIDFDEELSDGLSVGDLEVSNADALRLADLMMVADTSMLDDVEVRYQLTVTLTDATMPVTLMIKAGTVADMKMNPLDLMSSTYTPPTAPAAPAGLTATPAVGSVTFTWTAVAGTMYEYSTDGGTNWMDVATSGTQTVSSTTAVTFMVRVKASGSTPVGIAATLSGTSTTPAPPTDTPDMLTSLSVPAESYVVLVRNKATVKGLPASVTDAQKIGWAGMPDLEALFVSGGSLALTRNKTPQIDGRDAKVRDLVITEVMWARNLAVVGQAGEMDHQWIEIYNPLKVAVSGVTVTTKARKPALTSTGNEVQLDMLSNIVGSGWAFDIGQNGYHDATNAEAGRIEFVSMYRNNRAGDKHGWVKGHWSASSETYLPNYKGTPGKGERAEVQTVATTSFNVGPVIFNEVSNRSSGTYEWFELRNKSDSEQNLKNREIRIVKDVGSDVSLFQFGDQDAKIPAKGVLLCVFTDPRNDPNHPIATGWNIDLGAADQINGVGDHSPRYIVVNDHGKRVYNEAALGDEGLPAEFVLILRSRRHNDDIGKDTNIWDIAGYDTSLKIGAAEAGFTNLWPLKGAVRNAQLSNNKWDVGTVHRRQKDNVWGTSSTNYGRNGGNHADDTAWRNVGWTGIGYRRNAAANNENGGTPGYNNGVLKSRETTSGTADENVPVVIITEVMYATGNRANLPQWIELYNPSKTHGINMDGWRVTILNHDLDADGEPYAGDLSKNYAINGKIPPGQTYLLTAYSARNDTNLPSERIHFLRGNKRGELIFSQYGFEITLLTYGKDNNDANRKVVDKVGNLAIITGPGRVRTNPQSYEDPAWALPMSTNEDGNRVSIVRVSIDGDPIDGQREGAWKLFDMSEQFVKTLEETDYGHGSDEGSPGHTVGGVLPVSLSKFRPERLDTGEVIVRWITESELDNAGFNILRGEALDGEFTKLNEQLIAGKGTTSERTTYEFVDTSAKPNVVYYYQIQDVSLDGDVATLRTTHLRGNISVVGKLTTTWGELKALQ